ncbi:MAG: hypothetical protein HONBIEJF_00869 [Fimbriimonadaceae bacterium]|nr:hypothetical protein [Fimbriimonadaceae bacterium]
MATIRPFRGLRYSAAAGPLEALVAPPYDVLSQEERNEYAARSPHNVVHLTLPEQNEDDRSKFVKYARAAARLEEWRREGQLAAEGSPSLYRYRQTFSIPGDTERHERLALITLIKVEPYEKGVVLPHEQTFPKHKEDRLRILEATRAHLECIYGLYEDESQGILQEVKSAPATTVASVATDDGVTHQIEVIDDGNVLDRILSAMEPKKIWIADGHHRYETALAFRQALGSAQGEVAEDYMMMALSSIADPGLVLLPTHRILDKVSLTSDEIASTMRANFPHEEVENSDLVEWIEANATGGQRAFGVALPGTKGLGLRIGDVRERILQIKGSESDRLKGLDVTILHKLMFEELLGLTGHDFFSYTRDAGEAIAAVNAGARASFLMNPPTVDDMRQIALGGEKMPQKSTYYYPKILSGLLLWSLADFEA